MSINSSFLSLTQKKKVETPSIENTQQIQQTQKTDEAKSVFNMDKPEGLDNSSWKDDIGMDTVRIKGKTTNIVKDSAAEVDNSSEVQNGKQVEQTDKTDKANETEQTDKTENKDGKENNKVENKENNNRKVKQKDKNAKNINGDKNKTGQTDKDDDKDGNQGGVGISNGGTSIANGTTVNGNDEGNETLLKIAQTAQEKTGKAIIGSNNQINTAELKAAVQEIKQKAGNDEEANKILGDSNALRTVEDTTGC